VLPGDGSCDAAVGQEMTNPNDTAEITVICEYQAAVIHRSSTAAVNNRPRFPVMKPKKKRSNVSAEQLELARIARRVRILAEEARTKAQHAKAAWKQARAALVDAKRAAKRARKAVKEAQASFRRAMLKKKRKKK
jgi:hypothetical protein